MITNNILFRLRKMETRRIAYFFILFAILFGGSESQAQVTGANGPITWGGYVAVYSNSSGAKGGSLPLWGSPWGVSDLATSISGSYSNKLVLFPNYNLYNATDPYWANGSNGNKWLEVSTIATNSLQKLNLTKPIVFWHH